MASVDAMTFWDGYFLWRDPLVALTIVAVACGFLGVYEVTVADVAGANKGKMAVAHGECEGLLFFEVEQEFPTLVAGDVINTGAAGHANDDTAVSITRHGENGFIFPTG